MIYFRREGEKLKQGFNIYPWKDNKTSIGFLILIKNRLLGIRYNRTKNLFYLLNNSASR